MTHRAMRADRRRPLLRALGSLGVMAMAGAWGPRVAAAATPLRLGLIPYLSPRALVAVFEPLRTHLQAQLGREVVLYSATSLRAQSEAIARGDYDLVFSAPHILRWAATEHGWPILAQTSASAQAQLMARRGHAIAVPEGLRGRIVLLQERSAIVTMIGLDWLREHGLEPGRDVEVRFLQSASSLLRGPDADAAAALVIIDSQLLDFEPAVRDTVQTVAVMRRFPAPGYAASPRLSAAEIDALRSALLSFGGTADGKGSLSRSPLQAADLADLERIDRYARQLKTLLQAPR